MIHRETDLCLEDWTTNRLDDLQMQLLNLKVERLSFQKFPITF